MRNRKVSEQQVALPSKQRNKNETGFYLSFKSISSKALQLLKITKALVMHSFVLPFSFDISALSFFEK